MNILHGNHGLQIYLCVKLFNFFLPQVGFSFLDQIVASNLNFILVESISRQYIEG